MNTRKIRTAIMSAALVGAISCGVAAPAATAATPASVGSIVTAQTYSDSFTKRTFDLINAERAKVGAKPFVWNQKVADVSQDWANQLGVATMDPNWDIANIHRPDAGGSLIPAGYTGYRENIAFNFTPEQIVQWWMNSPGHKASMLNPNLTDAGLGYVKPTIGPYAGWYLMVSNMAAYPTTTAPAPTPAPSTGVTAGTQYKTTIQLNFRSGPSLTDTVLGSGSTGTIVTATGKTSGVWYEVKLNGQTGWMSSDYLIKYADAPAAQTPLAIKAAQINGALGAAVGPEVSGLKDGGSFQNFQNGALIYSPASGARVSTGAIRNTWASMGFEGGRMGYPVSDEVGGLRNGGVFQNYQGGAIIWSPKTGAQISVGAIRNKWAETGFENGGLGYPVTGEIGGLRNGGVFQNFEGGSVLWSPSTGAHISVGGIRTVWAATGYESGRLGYPVTDEVGGLRNGGVYQNYEGGAIIWSPATGGFVSFGGIRSIWASTGFEGGRLGYPTSNEYATGANGEVAQNYEGGVIHWTPWGSWITYK